MVTWRASSSRVCVCVWVVLLSVGRFGAQFPERWRPCGVDIRRSTHLPPAHPTPQLGASRDDPSPGGYTPLSVAMCWEQAAAASLLLQLGADPNQVSALAAGEWQFCW